MKTQTLITITVTMGLCALFSTGCAHVAGGGGPVSTMTYTPPIRYYQPSYSPSVIHFYGSGIGGIQAGLMNNLGRR